METIQEFESDKKRFSDEEANKIVGLAKEHRQVTVPQLSFWQKVSDWLDTVVERTRYADRDLSQ